MPGEEIFYLSVSELAKRIESKKLSPVDLTQFYLDRSQKFGPRFNAYARLTPETALAQAKATLDTTKADLAVAKLNYTRLQSLPPGATAQQDVDTAKSAVDKLLAQSAVNEALIRTADITRANPPTASNASCNANELMTVANIPM